MRREITVVVNGEARRGEVFPGTTLLEFLRDGLFLRGAKEGCGVGECGACTVLLDDKAVNACLVLAVEADGRRVSTIEGEAQCVALSDLQRAFIDHGAVQCGFCTPGMIMSARALLERSPQPSRGDIVEAISGNLCRCTGYEPIIEAIAAVARRRATTKAGGARHVSGRR